MSSLSPASRIKANLQQLFEAKLAPGDPYIKFQLTSKITVLMSMSQVEESGIIKVEKITPLPGMPPSVIGMMNSRDRVFCIFDLAQLLSLSSSPINLRQYQIVILEVSQTINREDPLYIGLAVEELQGIVRLTEDKINSLDNMSLLANHHNLEKEQKPISELIVLEAQTILNKISANNNS